MGKYFLIFLSGILPLPAQVADYSIETWWFGHRPRQELGFVRQPDRGLELGLSSVVVLLRLPDSDSAAHRARPLHRAAFPLPWISRRRLRNAQRPKAARPSLSCILHLHFPPAMPYGPEDGLQGADDGTVQ